jgi:hypothetical protein
MESAKNLPRTIMFCVTPFCARAHLDVFDARANSDCLSPQYIDVNTHQTFSLLVLPCIQDAEFMELEAMEPKDRSGAPHLVLV